jgi:myo-inositol-1(or 4)-monophosphatase
VSSLDLLHLAKTAAERAAKYLRGVERPADPGGWTLKGSRDFVTEVDRAAERIIAEVLLAAEPGSRIVGEELQPDVVTEGLVWVVDPLDGTTNFLHDFPSYAVSIAGAVDGILEVAVIVNVPQGDTYTAARGGGSWQGERRLAVSAIADPGFALIGTGFPFKDTSRIAEYLGQFERIASRASGIRRPGAASLDLADVAAGRFDGFWEQQLSAWDIAAGTLLIREAGGLVTDLGGREIGVEHSGVVAGNSVIHAWLLEMVGPSTDSPRRHGGHGGFTETATTLVFSVHSSCPPCLRGGSV